MNFKKSDNALLFWLIIHDFFSKHNRACVIDNMKLEVKMLQIFKKQKKKCIVNFRIYKTRKKV